MLVQLNDWAVVASAFAPPEMGIRLSGVVTNHPRKVDGMRILTTPVAKALGRTCTTESGTVYQLGSPAADYREWLQEHRPNWDPENPITVKTLK